MAGANHSGRMIWSSNLRCRALSSGATLRLHTYRPASVVWTTDAWATTKETPTVDTTRGSTLFTSVAGVESAWEIVDGVTRGHAPAEHYAIGDRLKVLIVSSAGTDPWNDPEPSAS